MLTDLKNSLTAGLSKKFAANYFYISHRTLSVSLHYLAKLKFSNSVIILVTDITKLPPESDFYWVDEFVFYELPYVIIISGFCKH